MCVVISHRKFYFRSCGGERIFFSLKYILKIVVVCFIFELSLSLRLCLLRDAYLVFQNLLVLKFRLMTNVGVRVETV